MTEILETAIEKAKILSRQRQDEVGRVVLEMIEQDQSKLQLSVAQQDEVRRRLAGPVDLVDDAEMHAFFRKLVG